MDVILIVIPFFEANIVGILDMLKNLFQTVRYGIVYYLPPILYYKYQMIIEREHRMIITFQKHCNTNTFCDLLLIIIYHKKAIFAIIL